MLNFGTVDGHSNWFSYADNVNWEYNASYSLAFFASLNTVDGASRYLYGKALDGTNGWVVRTSGADIPMTTHYNAGFVGNMSANTAIDGTVRSYIFVYTGGTGTWYRNTTADGAQALAGAAADGNPLRLGAAQGAGTGYALDMGQVMFWQATAITAGSRTAYHNGTGGLPPEYSALDFWIRGVSATESDIITLTVPTVNGTVALVANAIDNYWVPAGGFVMFLTNVLLPIFGEHLYRNADLFGPGSFRDLEKIVPFMNKRCTFDWTRRELEGLIRNFERRPIYASRA